MRFSCLRSVKRHLPYSIACCIALLLAGWTGISSARAADKNPIRLILDTDIETDFDDVGAVALLHALADNGEVDVLAMCVSATNPNCVPCLDAINTYYGRPDIPIGIVQHSPRTPELSAYSATIAKEFPHDLRGLKNAPAAEKLYRRVLAKQPDHSVVIVTIGFLTNLRNLLETSGDRYSPLDGQELVSRKVKAWVCMGGIIPQGREPNLRVDTASSAYCFEHWPTRIVFSPFKLGERVITGPALRATPKSNPVRRAYELSHGLNGHASWDQTAVFYAVRGLDGGLANVWGLRDSGSMHMLPDGTNQWRSQPVKDQWYLVEKMPPYKVSAMIDRLMAQPPKRLKAAGRPTAE
jgi:inosine-uridine nucleoside N-ribohydrolase